MKNVQSSRDLASSHPYRSQDHWPPLLTHPVAPLGIALLGAMLCLGLIWVSTASAQVNTCGNGIIDGVAESCDPPGSPAGVNGNPCQPDCTFCGDLIVQGAESCDDGNAVDGKCGGVEADDCRNDCTFPICRDPSEIVLRTPPELDRLKAHGRIDPPAPFMPADDAASVRVFRPDGTTVFEASIPAGSLVANSSGSSFRYRDAGARALGGFRSFAVRRHATAWVVALEAYGDLDLAVDARMNVRVGVDGRVFSVDGDWSRTRRGWKLTTPNSHPN